MAVTVAAVAALTGGTAIYGFGASGAGYAAAHGMSVGAIVMSATASILGISSGFARTIKMTFCQGSSNDCGDPFIHFSSAGRSLGGSGRGGFRFGFNFDRRGGGLLNLALQPQHPVGKLLVLRLQQIGIQPAAMLDGA